MQPPLESVVVFAPDLLMRHQLVQAGADAGFSMRGAATEARLATALQEHDPRIVVIELDGVGVDPMPLLERLLADGRVVVGFCAHTRVELITAARDAGASKVVSRGEITRQLDKVLTAAATATG